MQVISLAVYFFMTRVFLDTAYNVGPKPYAMKMCLVSKTISEVMMN